MIRTLKGIFGLLTPADRWQLLRVGVVMLLAAVGEVIGVSSITPFIAVLSRPELIQQNAQLSWLYRTFEFTSTRSFLLALGALFLSLYFLSLALRGFGAWVQFQYANERARSWSRRLLAEYLRQPYQWFLSKNSAELNSSILSEVDNSVWNALVPAITIAAQALVALMLLGLLVVADPALAAGASVFVAIGYISLNAVVRDRLRSLGDERWHAERSRFRVVNEAFGGVKEVKLYNLEADFVSRFNHFASIRSARMTSTSLLSQLPSLAMQGLLFGGMMLALLYLVATRGSFGDAIPIVGLYALAGYRMMPAIQRIFEESAKLRGAETMVASLVETLHALEATTPISGGDRTRPVLASTNRRRLIVEQIVYGYPGADRPALSGVSLEIPLGSSIGIVGASGSGKSTLVDIMLGLLHPDSGYVHLVDGDGSSATRALRDRVGYIPQQIFLADDSIAANIAFGVVPESRNRDAIEKAARLAKLHDFIVTELPDGYDTSVGERGVKLSGGQRQRIGIARALYRSPDILIMDEATSALDNLTEAEVMEGMKALGRDRTLIMVAHRLSTVRDCDCIFLLEHGRVTAYGRYDELVSRSEYFARLAAKVS